MMRFISFHRLLFALACISFTNCCTQRIVAFNFKSSHPRRYRRIQQKRSPVLQQQQQQQHTHHDAEDDGNKGKSPELRFNLMNLIRDDDDIQQQELKMQSLASLVRCGSNAEQGDGDVDHTIAMEDTDIDLPEQIAPYRRFLCTSSNTNDHRGNFRIFTSTSPNSDSPALISVPPNIIFSSDEPFSFLRDAVSYQSTATKDKRGGMMYDYSEVVVWCGSDSDSTDGSLEYISRVLDDMPLVQLFVGVAEQDDTIDVDIDLETLAKLKSMSMGKLIDDIDIEETKEDKDKIMCKLKHEDLDAIEAVLSCNRYQLPDGNMSHEEEQTIIKLIDTAVEYVRSDPLNESNRPQLVLMADGITATRIVAAISTWKHQQIEEQQQSTRRVEDLLNLALTVVTFGNISQSFPGGPAYIHISMLDDPWSTQLGATANNPSPTNKANGGGQDAVYFHGLSPFVYNQDAWSSQQQKEEAICSLKTQNAHNLHACTIQFFALILRINGIRSFRALYESAKWIDPMIQMDINPKHFAVNYGKKGDLVIPPRIDDELLPAMIRATGGEQWLWHNDDIEFESLLPDEIEATSHLEESFGYSAYDELCDSFSCSQ